jgi:hypothetical protein
MIHVAGNYSILGRHGEALKLYEDTLALRRTMLGPDHPDTLSTMYRLADEYAALDRQAEALRLREELLALRKAKLGPDHPDTLFSMYALAISYTAVGRHAEAVRLHEEAAVAFEKQKRTDSMSLYNAACYRAATAAAIRAGDKSGSESQRVAAETDRAMDWLRQAVASGYGIAARLKEDKDLDILRDREDFKKLLADLERRSGSAAKKKE